MITIAADSVTRLPATDSGLGGSAPAEDLTFHDRFSNGSARTPTEVSISAVAGPSTSPRTMCSVPM